MGVIGGWLRRLAAGCLSKEQKDMEDLSGVKCNTKQEGSRMAETKNGKVKWFDASKGFGFICGSEANKDYFVHFSSIKSEGYRKLVDGEEVTFEIGTTPKGECAVNVVRLNPPAETERRPRTSNVSKTTRETELEKDL